MAKRQKKSTVRSLLNPRNVIIPTIIGAAVAIYMFYQSFDIEKFSNVNWAWSTLWWLLLALLAVAVRDLGYMFRIRHMTDKHLTWRKAFDVILLWEFSSAISPSVVGGSGVAIFILNKEDLNVGKSTAVVMVTALLDELFYVLMVPIVLLIAGTTSLFPVAIQKEFFGYTLSTVDIFVIGYIFIVILTATISFAIFISPKTFSNLLMRIFSLGFLSRWKSKAVQTGNDIITTSTQLKNKPFKYWVIAFGSTLFSWTARFWTANFIIAAFTTMALTFNDHMLIYARQLIMWVIMLISPTPGGAGIAELAFEGFLGKFIYPIEFAVTIAILWRLLTYYLYLIMGSIILPQWIRRVYLKRNLIKFKK